MNRPREGEETAGKSGDWAAFGHSGWSSKCWGQFLGETDIPPCWPWREMMCLLAPPAFPVRIRVSGSSVFSLLPLCQMKSFSFMVVSALESTRCLCGSWDRMSSPQRLASSAWEIDCGQGDLYRPLWALFQTGTQHPSKRLLLRVTGCSPKRSPAS